MIDKRTMRISGYHELHFFSYFGSAVEEGSSFFSNRMMWFAVVASGDQKWQLITSYSYDYHIIITSRVDFLTI